ncbi:MAG: YggS family pyridoxal phosphate-dependent enzyme [Proteobacteria bacterium]|nr:YggS family pyridoxal phosphate-dependent enzyme [Pseudomonadota bacterium]
MNDVNIAKNIASLHNRVRLAAQKSQRSPEGICIVAASKTRSAAIIQSAYEGGIRNFGENYLQEALEKITTLGDLDLNWHFIGPIQSNKTRAIAENFDWVHSVDRLKIARRLSEQRPNNLAPLQICLQVNISAESSKSGASPAEMPELVQAVKALPGITLRGLMAIPAPTDDRKQQQQAFAQMRELMAALRANAPTMDTLSMGMSADLEVAIAQGSTLIRVGTDIFGPRSG